MADHVARRAEPEKQQTPLGWEDGKLERQAHEQKGLTCRPTKHPDLPEVWGGKTEKGSQGGAVKQAHSPNSLIVHIRLLFTSGDHWASTGVVVRLLGVGRGEERAS